MTRQLPFDIARCNDSECPMREGCLRWEERHEGRVHVASLREGDECESRIQKSEVME
jgi:hypothetical protein